MSTDLDSSSAIPFTKRLDGKVAIITGGASGIGECTARLFIKHGAKVLIADIQDELGHFVCTELGSRENISYVHCDVTCESDVQNVVELAVSKFGKLDIMFNNAGIPGITNHPSGTSNYDTETFKRVMDVNVFGAFLGAKYASKVMIPAKKGCILFTSSVASVTFGGTSAAYAASKTAVVGMTKNLCVELGQYGIRVNCISPFGVASPMLSQCMHNMEKKKIEEVVSSSANLKGEVVEAEDIAEAALYLGSDESKYVSGLNLVVDGGYSLTNPTFSRLMKSKFS
ncbi:secoisolariciresinol dehydrogenase-like [Quillaja saponaria]|uniref:Secoisolariciresinol dehydrogenase-like n=1 Tax=Quillaja saponaria TaxID=32244 RepID=A0AAD7VDJ1_QUISA|nr:secoisolariciresinol dehydrogenase-like [Quillaja saponaria]KAJ7971590.1 secoisolariciresinol dehydrogenase-like [Quillaja saponaria]